MRHRILDLVGAAVVCCALATLSHGQAQTSTTEAEADALTRQRLKAIALAIHVYTEKNNLELPPAVIDNPSVPAEKRLSGLVLLLPLFGEKPSYLDDATWESVRIDPEEAAAAKELFNTINRKRAWDDPANLQAARTIVPVFLSQALKPTRNRDGFAVSHFAFLRGYGGQEDGAFPAGRKVAVFDPQNKKDWIADGSVMTLGVGQINTDLGPWIAAGPSSSRHLIHPSEQSETPSFGSHHGQACYFAKCDGSITFIDLRNSTAAGLSAFTTRAGRDERLLSGTVRSYSSAAEWMKAQGRE